MRLTTTTTRNFYSEWKWCLFPVSWPMFEDNLVSSTQITGNSPKQSKGDLQCTAIYRFAINFTLKPAATTLQPVGEHTFSPKSRSVTVSV